MTTKVIVIPKFSGNPKDFPEYRKDYEGKAALASIYHPQGLTGLVMSRKKFKKFTMSPQCVNGIAKFELLPETVPAKENEDFHVWEYHAKRKTAETAEVLAYRTAFEDSLDPISKRRMSDDDHGLSKMSLFDMVDWLDKRFGTPTAVTLKDNLKLMATVRVEDGSTSMDEYISTFHEEPHKVAKKNNNNIAMTTRVQSLLDGVEQCGVYRDVLSHFHFTYKTPEEWEFDQLADQLRAFDARTTRKTSGGSGLINQVVTVNAPLSLQALSDKLDYVLTALSAAAVQERAPVKLQLDPPYYCWSHGPNHTHNGDSPCNYPRPGHQSAATAANKMGGATGRTRHRNNSSKK
jgi:hypothetical protein